MGYFKDALKGVTWMTAFRAAYRILGIIRISIIAHILSPYELGVFGIATISLGFLEIITETGINVFLLQEKDDINKFINSAWVVSIFRGILISIIIVATAGPVSLFFKSPESRNLLYLVAVVPLLRGFINPSIVKFQKELFFGKQFNYLVSVYFVESTLSVIGALLLRNPLGLVLGIIGGVVYELFYTFLAVKPRPLFIIEFEKVKKVLKRGVWVTMFGIFDYIYTNGDNVIVGRLLGASPLGIYQNAYKISTTPLTEVGDVFFRVTFPIFSKISDDVVRLKKAFIKNLIVNATLMISAGVFIYLFASPIVKILFGPGWDAAIPVVRLLSILGVIRGLIGATGSLLLSRMKQRYTATVAFVGAAGLLVTIVPLVNKYGIMGAGISAIIGASLTVPLVIYYLRRTLYAKE